MKKQNKIEVDVMIKDMFYGTFFYEHNPLFKFDIQGVVLAAEQRFPTLKYKDYHLEIGHGNTSYQSKKLSSYGKNRN